MTDKNIDKMTVSELKELENKIAMLKKKKQQEELKKLVVDIKTQIKNSGLPEDQVYKKLCPGARKIKD